MPSSSDLSLEISYNEVFKKSQLKSGFDAQLLQGSLALFDCDNLQKIFKPKCLEVNALLGGIEFSKNFQKFVIQLQQKLDEIIQTQERYWVLPQNLGIEYLVTKWPEEKLLSNDLELLFLNEIAFHELRPYLLQVRGFQVNPDGCVILRGYDNGHILDVRKRLKRKFDWLPSRQSGWAHIPIGRILCELPEFTYRKLISECEQSFTSLFFEEKIEEIHYVHEQQWYMEKKIKKATFPLLSSK